MGTNIRRTALHAVIPPPQSRHFALQNILQISFWLSTASHGIDLDSIIRIEREPVMELQNTGFTHWAMIARGRYHDNSSSNFVQMIPRDALVCDDVSITNRLARYSRLR